MNRSSIGQVVVLGGSGLLGTAWSRVCSLERSWLAQPVSYSRAECDILSSREVRATIRPGVQYVINCAGYTNVDRAERQETLATGINGAAVGIIADRCKEVGATLVHYSTDYVFDGKSQSDYRVTDEPSPINAYGRGKAIGEQIIRQSGVKHLLVRTSWLFAEHGDCFVRTIADRAKSGTPLTVVDDQIGRPTLADDVVRASARLLQHDARGTFHIGCRGTCSWYDVAAQTAAWVNPACTVSPCKTADRAGAPRPKRAVLDLSATERLIGQLPYWSDALRDTLSRMTPRRAAA